MAQPNRPGVGALQLAGLFVLLVGVVGIVATLDALGGDGFGNGASDADKLTFVVTAAVPIVVGAGLLFGLSRVVDLLYDLRDGRVVQAVTAPPADQGPAY